MSEATDWITSLRLLPHPEGGHYRETYRANLAVMPAEHDGLTLQSSDVRSAATSIYFLLDGVEFSALHRIRADEIWYHHSGGSLRIEALSPDGQYVSWSLGTDISNGDIPQVVVPAGYWFGAELADKTSFALVGCCVAPGFEFADFELGNRGDLVRQYPQHTTVILRLTHETRL